MSFFFKEMSILFFNSVCFVYYEEKLQLLNFVVYLNFCAEQKYLAAKIIIDFSIAVETCS